jgi:hypothetical protein
MERTALVFLAFVLATLCSCADGGTPPPGDAAWLGGTADERFALVAKHLRGLDVTMVEVGHRYQELYWAGHDRNWDYARYQAGKIRLAVANGVERRPKRAASAEMLEGALVLVETSIERQDDALFDQAFEGLTETCNACHRKELVPFMTVVRPEQRLSPVRFDAAAAAEEPSSTGDTREGEGGG